MSGFGISLFGISKEEKRKRGEERKRAEEEERDIGESNFPEKMDFELKKKNPTTGKYDSGGSRRRRRSRKSKKSKKSNKNKKSRKYNK